MTTNLAARRWPAPKQRSRAAMLTLLIGLAVGGCDQLLDVELPGKVRADDLDDPGKAVLLVNGAIAAFECAFSGYVAATGVYTDEFLGTATWRVIFIWDARLPAIADFGAVRCAPTRDEPNHGTLLPLQIARFQAEDAYQRIETFPAEAVPNKEQLLATAAAYAGYSYTLLGEGFCEMAIDGGPRMAPAEVLVGAEEWFTTALQHAAAANDANDIRTMALVGRARVRLNLGKRAEAVEDARQVPEGFVRYSTHSQAIPERENRVFTHSNINDFHSVYPSFRDLTVDGVPDPRVPVENTGRVGHDGLTPQWNQLKYTSVVSPIPLATWKEAQLIIAEVEGGESAVAAINRLRARFDLPRFSSTDPDEIRLQVIEERRRELFAEGHRLNDMLRLSLPWPEGFVRGEAYGPGTCLPLMNAETFNNPNFGN